VAGLAEILLEYVLGFGFDFSCAVMAAVKNYQAEVRRDVEALSARAKATRAQQRSRATHRCQKFAQTACSGQR
jgi:aminoglycoside phosphotransferase family enzyme